VLPFEILLLEMQLGNSIPLPAFRQLAAQPASSGSQSGYRRWLQLLHEGKPLFSGTPDLKRIVIFGSMLTAHLLVLAARKRGIAVLCCVDSSKSRIGNKVLDIPIAPLEALEKISHLDAVILSSERDHEDGLKNMLHPLAGNARVQDSFMERPDDRAPLQAGKADDAGLKGGSQKRMRRNFAYHDPRAYGTDFVEFRGF